MIGKLIAKIKSMAGGINSFDPSSLDDSLAMQTKWTPVQRGGSSFLTHKLDFVNSSRAEFRATMRMKLFFLLFVFIGVVVFFFITRSFSSQGSPFYGFTILLWLFPSIFVLVGGVGLFLGTKPIVFDKTKGFFWKGRKTPHRGAKRSSLKDFAELEQIYALQLISEYCRSGSSSNNHYSYFYSYELNLVLKDGKRINVVDHGDLNKLRDDAARLSNFLDKPVWDAI